MNKVGQTKIMNAEALLKSANAKKDEQCNDFVSDVQVGGVTTAVVGGSLGLLGGPIAPITVLAGAVVGYAAGGIVSAQESIADCEDATNRASEAEDNVKKLKAEFGDIGEFEQDPDV